MNPKEYYGIGTSSLPDKISILHSRPTGDVRQRHGWVTPSSPILPLGSLHPLEPLPVYCNVHTSVIITSLYLRNLLSPVPSSNHTMASYNNHNYSELPPFPDQISRETIITVTTTAFLVYLLMKPQATLNFIKNVTMFWIWNTLIVMAVLGAIGFAYLELDFGSATGELRWRENWRALVRALDINDAALRKEFDGVIGL